MILALLGCMGWQTKPIDYAALGMRSIDVPDGTLRVQDTGPRDASAVLLLPGFGAALESFGPTAETLSADHRVIAIDHRGFGLSSRYDGDYSLSALADDVVRVLDERGVSSVVVVGHSFGGAVGLAFATTHPHRVDGLVLVDALAYERQVPWELAASRGPLGPAIMGAFYTAATDLRLEQSFHDPSRLTWHDVHGVEQVSRIRGSRRAALEIARELDLHPWSGRYASLNVPALVIWGRQDRLTPARGGVRLATDLGARLELVDDCGHFPMLEQPDAFVDLLHAFLHDA